MSCSVRSGRMQADQAALRKDVSDLRATPLLSGRTQVELEERVALAASKVVGKNRVVANDLAFRADCSGTARGIYAKAGFDLKSESHQEMNDVARLHALVKEQGSLRNHAPRIGDLIFFDNTYDKNHDGKLNDKLSHIGVVEKIEPDGTILFVHRIHTGIVRFRMNLQSPKALRNKKGERQNHRLVRARDGAPAKTAAELFSGFGTLPAEVFKVRGDSAVVASR